MVPRAEGASADPVRSALDLLAQFQESVTKVRSKKEPAPGELVIDADTFEYVTGSVMPDFADLRRALGGRLDMYNVRASALPNPNGGGWYLRLEDEKGQRVDFKIDRNDMSEIFANIHQHAGLGQLTISVDTPDGIQQLGRLLATAKVDEDFKAEVPLAARYVGEVRRALVPTQKKDSARAVMALNNALQGAAEGRTADMEKLISMYIESGFSFRRFNKVYGDSDKEYISIELSDKDNNEVSFQIDAQYDSNGDRIVNHTCEMKWTIREQQKGNMAAPNNADEIRGWMNKFEIYDPGSRGNSNGIRTGSKSLNKTSEKKFVVELIRFAKNRKWVTPDLSKGSLGRYLKL